MNEKQWFPMALYLANDRREREVQAAARERSVARRPRPSLRWSLGQSLVKFGERLAGEAHLEPARFR
ncbi:MAG TPA: hypothetical protein VNM34_10705 [Verrucomicrobiae bacterium]|nr:hypothetical protein [Verrucomicrobiae bacterium]